MINDAVFNAEFYSKLNKLTLALKMKLAEGMNGGRKSRAKGNSVEFSDFREYLLGDDIRRIDWNAYGRFDKLFVKLFMEEKEGLFQVFLDASTSMSFGEQSKSVCAQRIAAAFAYVVLENSDRFCLNILRGEKNEAYKALTGRQGFSRVTDNLSKLDFLGETHLLTALRRKQFTQRGVSVLISDFYTDELEECLKYLTLKKQEIILVQVLSREEKEPLFEKTVRLLDSESDASLKVTMSGNLQREYKKSYDSFVQKIDALCRKYSAQYIRVLSDESLDTILYGELNRLFS